MELYLLKDIVIIFALSTLVNVVFTRMKIPTVVGYLLTGIIAGPHLLSLVQEEHNIELLAEIGVALLLFTIGMEFSLKSLIRIRRIVFLGGLLQVGLTAAVFFGLFRMRESEWSSGVLFGFLIALSSSALVLKLLQERSELTSNYGRTVLGILIFQDLLLVPLLLFTNFLGNAAIDVRGEIILLAFKAFSIIVMVYLGNKWLMPKLLHFIAMAKNQELFMMSIFLICFSIALLTSELGMSFAFGAFLAGLMIADSEYSHNAFGNIIPFKDTFTSFFFVSIGMLLDLQFVLNNLALVLAAVLLVILIKTIIAGGVGFLLGHTFQGTVMVGLALSQVGEFSFILAKIGFDKNILSPNYYQLFLAVAVITMATTPFAMNISRPLSMMMLKLPLPDFLVKGLFPLKEIQIPILKNHMVIIGKDPSALKLAVMAKYYDIPHVSIIFDPGIAKEKINEGDLVVYGDAVNEPILLKAHVDTADIVVVSVGKIIPSMAIIDTVRKINKKAHILARARSTNDVADLYEVGADQVLPEKLEIAVNLFNRVLLKKLYPRNDINRMLMRIRTLNLGSFTEKDVINRPTLWDEFSNIDISAVTVEEKSEAEGKSIYQLNLRRRSGVTLLALRRGGQIIEHPEPDTVLYASDIAYLLGNPEQINFAGELFLSTQGSEKE